MNEIFGENKGTVTYETCNVQGSCGHWLPRFWFESGADGVAYKSEELDEDGYHNCVVYASVCPECYVELFEEEDILWTEEQEQEWIR